MTIKSLNCSEYQTLKKYERQMLTATKANYISGLKLKDCEALFAVYNRITGLKEKATACPKCVLRITRVLAGAYDRYVAKMSKKQAEKKAETAICNDETDILNKKEEQQNATEDNNDSRTDSGVCETSDADERPVSIES